MMVRRNSISTQTSFDSNPLLIAKYLSFFPMFLSFPPIVIDQVSLQLPLLQSISIKQVSVTTICTEYVVVELVPSTSSVSSISNRSSLLQGLFLKKQYRFMHSSFSIVTILLLLLCGSYCRQLTGHLASGLKLFSFFFSSNFLKIDLFTFGPSIPSDRTNFERVKLMFSQSCQHLMYHCICLGMPKYY